MPAQTNPAIFCCHAQSLSLLAQYHNHNHQEHALWDFACHMSEVISPTPSSTISNASSDLIPSSDSNVEKTPASFINTVLSQSKCVVQFERWVDGENSATRFFAKVEGMEKVYLEVGREALHHAGWVWGWSHIKLRCKHKDTFYVLKLLEEVDETGERKKRVNGWTGEIKDEESGEGEMWELGEAREVKSEVNFIALESEDGNMMFDGQGRIDT